MCRWRGITFSCSSYKKNEYDGKTYTSIAVSYNNSDTDKVTDVSAFYYNELVKNIYPKQGIEAFAMREKALRDEWIEYIKEGNTLSKPTDYILVK